METVLLQINNDQAYKLLKDLEALKIIKVLKKTNRPADKKNAHSLLGIISKKDVDLMEKAIEEACEKINPDDLK